MILQKSSKAIIEIDGGVNIQNAPKIKQAGADALVAGNFVFSSSSPLEVIAELKNIQFYYIIQIYQMELFNELKTYFLI